MSLKQIEKKNLPPQDGKDGDTLDILLNLSKDPSLSLIKQKRYKIAYCQTLYNLEEFDRAMKISFQEYEALWLHSQVEDLVEPLLEFGTIYAKSLIRLGKITECWDFLDEIEMALKTFELEENSHKLILSTIFCFRCDINWFRGELDRALFNAQQALQMRETCEDPELIAAVLIKMGVVHCEQGDLESGLKILEESLTLYKHANNDEQISKILNNIAWVHKLQGNLDFALENLQESLRILKKIGMKKGVHTILANIGMIYRQKGDYDLALSHLKESLLLVNQIGNPLEITDVLFSLVNVMLDRKDFTSASLYFDQLKQIDESHTNKRIHSLFLIARALILKQHLRSKNIYLASTIFQQIIDEPVVKHELTVLALLNLSDLLLVELRISNDVAIIEEINLIIEQLLHIAQKQKSYILWAEIYSLQAKLALIQLDFKRARNLYNNAQLLAENQGLKQFAMKISDEHDQLLEKLSIWEEMAKSQATLAKRVDLADIGSQMQRMLRDGVVDNPKIIPETPILLNIMNETGPNIFTYKFLKDWQYDNQLFGALLSAFQSFSGEFFAESFDRAKFGKYNMLLKHAHPVIICYVFEGKSFLAKQKINHFMKLLRKNQMAWDCLVRSTQNNSVIAKGMSPTLEILSSQVFLDQNPQSH